MNSMINVFLRLKGSENIGNSKHFRQIDEQQLAFQKSSRQDEVFTFEHIFDETQHNYSVYQRSAQQLVNALLEGHNTNLLFYGQTASGKTFTMVGANTGKYSIESVHASIKRQQYNNIGLLMYSLLDLFKSLNRSAASCQYALHVSYFEIYNENVYDLLRPQEMVRENLQVYEDPKSKKFLVKGLTQQEVVSMEEVCSILNHGERNRHFSSTILNHCSSRSHALFTVDLSQFEGDRLVRSSRMTFIDLAGCERIDTQSKVLGKECQAINKSLFCLTRLLHLKSLKHTSHLPYRDSILTKIIKPTFDDQSVTQVILFVTPIDEFLEQNLQTLQFGVTSKSVHIQNVRKRQEVKIPQCEVELSGEVQELLLKLKLIIKDHPKRLPDETDHYIPDVGILASHERLAKDPSSQQAARITDLIYDYEGKFYRNRLEQTLAENSRMKALLAKNQGEMVALKADVAQLHQYLSKNRQQQLVQDQQIYIEKLERANSTHDPTEQNSKAGCQSLSSVCINFTSLINELSNTQQVENQDHEVVDSVTLELSKLLDDVEVNHFSKCTRKAVASVQKPRSLSKPLDAFPDKRKPLEIEQLFNHPSTTKKNKKVTLFERHVRSPLNYMTNQYRCNYKPRSLSYKSINTPSSSKENSKQRRIKQTKTITQFEASRDDFEEQIQHCNIRPQLR